MVKNNDLSFNFFKVAQDPCSHYVCIYLKSIQELQRLRTTTDETFMNTYFVKFFVLVITRYCFQL